MELKCPSTTPVNLIRNSQLVKRYWHNRIWWGTIWLWSHSLGQVYRCRLGAPDNSAQIAGAMNKTYPSLALGDRGSILRVTRLRKPWYKLRHPCKPIKQEACQQRRSWLASITDRIARWELFYQNKLATSASRAAACARAGAAARTASAGLSWAPSDGSARSATRPQHKIKSQIENGIERWRRRARVRV